MLYCRGVHVKPSLTCLCFESAGWQSKLRLMRMPLSWKCTVPTGMAYCWMLYKCLLTLIWQLLSPTSFTTSDGLWMVSFFVLCAFCFWKCLIASCKTLRLSPLWLINCFGLAVFHVVDSNGNKTLDKRTCDHILKVRHTLPHSSAAAICLWFLIFLSNLPEVQRSELWFVCCSHLGTGLGERNHRQIICVVRQAWPAPSTQLLN